MKNFILVFLLALPYLSNAQSIRAFYTAFEHSHRKSLENTETNQVLIDEANAFIQISNPQVPVDFIRFKCFVDSKGKKIFGFQYASAIVNAKWAVPRAEFYTYQNKQWQEVSEQVCPQLTFADFWGDNNSCDKTLQEHNLEHLMPQEGSSVLAKSSSAHSFQFPYDMMPEGYLETFKKAKFRTIVLNWNAQKGVFEVGKKY